MPFVSHEVKTKAENWAKIGHKNGALVGREVGRSVGFLADSLLVIGTGGGYFLMMESNNPSKLPLTSLGKGAGKALFGGVSYAVCGAAGAVVAKTQKEYREYQELKEATKGFIGEIKEEIAANKHSYGVELAAEVANNPVINGQVEHLTTKWQEKMQRTKTAQTVDVYRK
jgi:hypothetical protein